MEHIHLDNGYAVAPRTGAWIETQTIGLYNSRSEVAPRTGVWEVTGEVRQKIIRMTLKSRKELMSVLQLKHEDHFREACLVPALDIGWKR